MAVHHRLLHKNLRPEYVDHWEEIAAFLFEDPESAKEQSGFFKVRTLLPLLLPLTMLPLLLLMLFQIEGCFDQSYFRSNKAYYLSNRNEDSLETIVRRLRSIPRKHHSCLQPVHFGQNPATNTGVVRGLTMGPTMGLEILMTMQGRTLSRAYNFKRVQIVSNSGGCIGFGCLPSKATFLLLLLGFRIPCTA